MKNPSPSSLPYFNFQIWKNNWDRIRDEQLELWKILWRSCSFSPTSFILTFLHSLTCQAEDTFASTANDRAERMMKTDAAYKPNNSQTGRESITKSLLQLHCFFLFLVYSFEISCKMILTRGLELEPDSLSVHFRNAPVLHLQPLATRNVYLLGNFTDAIKDYIAIRDKMKPGASTENHYCH